MKDLATHALSQLLRLSAYTIAKLVVRRSTTLALVLAVGALLTAAGTARAEDWPTPGLDAGHARFSAERSGARFTRRALDWCAGGGRVLASPVVADGFVVTVDLEGTVRALRADDGAAGVADGAAVDGAGDAGDRARAGVRADGREQASWRCGWPTARSCGRATWAG